MATHVIAHKRQQSISRYISKRLILRVVVAGLLLYIMAMGFSGLRLSLHAIRGARVELLVLAAAAVACTYICAALTYLLLAARPIRFIPTLFIAVAGGLVNRLLPGGLGGLGINALYLRRNGHSLASATAVVAVNNMVGFAGNAVLIATAAALSPLALPHISWPEKTLYWTAGVIIAVLLVAFGLSAKNHHLHAVGVRTIREWQAYGSLTLRRPLTSLLALGSSICLTSCHALGLYMVMASVGIGQPWLVALIAVSIGSLSGAAVPTPGGVGGAEAGIAAGLLAYHTPATQAVAAALLYRGLTYWLPLLPGYLALRIAEKRYLY